MTLRFVFGLFALALVLCRPAGAALVADVRQAIARGDFQHGETLIADYRKARGVTPEMILALSWLGRGAQAAKVWDKAEAYAAETRTLCQDELKKRTLDAEPQLPAALGASIEVQAHVLAGRGQLAEAIAFLRQELKAWHKTSIRTRIQKDIHMLSLEGKPAPPLEMNEYLGPKPLPLAALKGKAILLFFWAHWCPDCKFQAPILARVAAEYGPKGLVIVGPTQRYGYVEGGREAPPAEELRYIDEVRARRYGAIGGMTAPVSEENFRNYGSSTTPTLVLLDRAGLVRLYHPGKMTYEELAPKVAAAVGG